MELLQPNAGTPSWLFEAHPMRTTHCIAASTPEPRDIATPAGKPSPQRPPLRFVAASRPKATPRPEPEPDRRVGHLPSAGDFASLQVLRALPSPSPRQSAR